MSSSDNDMPGHRSRLQRTLSGIPTWGKSLLGRNHTQRKSNRTVSVVGLPTGTFEPPQRAELLVLPVRGSWDQNQTKHYEAAEDGAHLQLTAAQAVSLHPPVVVHTPPAPRGCNFDVPLERGQGRKREACNKNPEPDFATTDAA